MLDKSISAGILFMKLSDTYNNLSPREAKTSTFMKIISLWDYIAAIPQLLFEDQLFWYFEPLFDTYPHGMLPNQLAIESTRGYVISLSTRPFQTLCSHFV